MKAKCLDMDMGAAILKGLTTCSAAHHQGAIDFYYYCYHTVLKLIVLTPHLLTPLLACTHAAATFWLFLSF